MTKQIIEIVNLDWTIYILYGCLCDDKEIEEQLRYIDCPESLIQDAKKYLYKCEYNKGLTYTNANLRESVVIIGITKNQEQLINTITHEFYHLVEQISNICKLSIEETRATLYGNIAMKLSKFIKLVIHE